MSKTILITGSSTGIGRASAKLFQEKGWNVVATMRTPEKETELQTLENTTLIDSSDYVGTLEAKERVNLAPRIQGRILKIFVQEGESVRQNQAIIELEPTQEQENVNAARESVNIEKSNLNQIQAELNAKFPVYFVENLFV